MPAPGWKPYNSYRIHVRRPTHQDTCTEPPTHIGAHGMQEECDLRQISGTNTRCGGGKHGGKRPISAPSDDTHRRGSQATRTPCDDARTPGDTMMYAYSIHVPIRALGGTMMYAG